jgi:hypothetical protein
MKHPVGIMAAAVAREIPEFVVGRKKERRRGGREIKRQKEISENGRE